MHGGKNAIDIPDDVGIPKPDDVNAFGLKESCACGVVTSAVGMLTAIELNGEPMFGAVKIQDAFFHPELTAELRAQPTVAQQFPCGLFRLS